MIPLEPNPTPTIFWATGGPLAHQPAPNFEHLNACGIIRVPPHQGLAVVVAEVPLIHDLSFLRVLLATIVGNQAA